MNLWISNHDSANGLRQQKITVMAPDFEEPAEAVAINPKPQVKTTTPQLVAPEPGRFRLWHDGQKLLKV